MNAVDFPESNFKYAENQDEYNTLHVHKPLTATPDGRVTSCWELTDEELEIVKATGKVYLRQLTFGHPLQPVAMTAIKEDFDLE